MRSIVFVEVTSDILSCVFKCAFSWVEYALSILCEYITGLTFQTVRMEKGAGESLLKIENTFLLPFSLYLKILWQRHSDVFSAPEFETNQISRVRE